MISDTYEVLHALVNAIIDGGKLKFWCIPSLSTPCSPDPTVERLLKLAILQLPEHKIGFLLSHRAETGATVESDGILLRRCE